MSDSATAERRAILDKIADRLSGVRARARRAPDECEHGVFLTDAEWCVVEAALRSSDPPPDASWRAGAEAEKAEAYARRAFAGRVDRAGQPYTGHLGRVAARARAHAEAVGLSAREAERCEAAGWLHDVIEDCSRESWDSLERAGFDAETCEAVDAVSRNGMTWSDGEPHYADWIDWIGRHTSLTAIIVKLADVEDNLDPSRVGAPVIPLSLLQRYGAARAVLREALARSLPTAGPASKGVGDA